MIVSPGGFPAIFALLSHSVIDTKKRLGLKTSRAGQPYIVIEARMLSISDCCNCGDVAFLRDDFPGLIGALPEDLGAFEEAFLPFLPSDEPDDVHGDQFRG